MGKIAFVFAGQGSQYTGMGKDLYENSKGAKEVFDEIEKLRPNTINQCFNGTKEELSQTINTQPCIFAVDLACAKALNEKRIYADAVAGFSLGEIPALYYSEILSLEESIKFIIKRAEFMQNCSAQNPGSMVAVLRLSKEQVENACGEFENLYPVNYNCQGQIVVAGQDDQMDLFSKRILEIGGKAIKLAVSGAFHSPFMIQASEEIEKYLAPIQIKQPIIPIYSNVLGDIYRENIKELVSLQVKSPVLWQDTIENMIDQGFDIFIEVGAGKVLSGLIKKISSEVDVYNVEDMISLEKTVSELNGGCNA
jgi:[acyl-carrier-protein] S-malonyltransferase